jgi:hypothetical protein
MAGRQSYRAVGAAHQKDRAEEDSGRIFSSGLPRTNMRAILEKTRRLVKRKDEPDIFFDKVARFADNGPRSFEAGPGVRRLSF